jgi:hypothetical protein
MNIYEKLDEARKLVRATPHKKDATNTYSKYDYFTPETIELIVAEVCEKTKMLPVCNLKRNEHGLYQEMILVDLEELDKTIVFQLATTHGQLKATNETQQMGGTDTYSERYLKMKVFQIKDNNLDPDGQQTQTTQANEDDLDF